VVIILSSSGWTALYGDLGGCVPPHHLPSIRFLDCLVAIIVGKTADWLPGLVERARLLKVNGGFEKGVDL
jgi:hypothetical protein